MSYNAVENAFKIDANTITTIENALNKGFCVEMDYDSKNDCGYIFIWRSKEA